MTDVIIGVDLGGTRIRAAQMDEKLNILNRVETMTLADEGLEPTLQRIKDLIRQVIPTDSPVKGIGISAPGPLHSGTGVIVAPPNLPGWHNVPLGSILHDEFNMPIFVGNDANVAALAETAVGAAQGYNHVVFITVSTGIGSGMIVDGRMLLGANDLAAEAGHMIMIVGDRVSDIEEEAAGPAMAEHARAKIEAGEQSLIAELVDGDLSRISGKTVGEAALQGDKLALDIVTQTGHTVGLGIVTLLHIFNPQIVVIGGGVSTLGDLLFKPMRQAIEKYAMDRAYWEDLVITPAGLGEDVSIIGAGALVVTQGGVINLKDVSDRLRS